MTDHAQIHSASPRLHRLTSRIPADFGQTHHLAPYCVFVPIAGVMAYLAWASGQISLSEAALLSLGGVLAWTLLEYVLHRFSFHSPSQHPLVRPFNSSLHLLHHEKPSSLLYVAAPIVLCVPVYALSLAVFRLLTGSLARTEVIGAVFALSFLFYEFVHYTAHQRSPKTRAMKFLKKHHMLHHFGDKQRRFGVTSPLWDFVFATYSGGAPARASRHKPPSAPMAS